MASFTLQKFLRDWKSKGAIPAASKGCSILTKVARATITVRGKTFNDIPSLLDFSYTTCGGIISPIQVREEISELLKLLEQRRPRRILEVGTCGGGTLFLLTRVAAEDAHIISLDLPMGQFGGGYPLWKIPLFRSFRLPGQRLDLVRADSHTPESLAKVKGLLGGEQLDFLFIDADHTYKGVKQDYEMYSPLVKPGGLVGFHDIKSRPNDEKTMDVERLWNEVKAGHEFKEIKYGDDLEYGIGVLTV